MWKELEWKGMKKVVEWNEVKWNEGTNIISGLTNSGLEKWNEFKREMKGLKSY